MNDSLLHNRVFLKCYCWRLLDGPFQVAWNLSSSVIYPLVLMMSPNMTPTETYCYVSDPYVQDIADLHLLFCWNSLGIQELSAPSTPLSLEGANWCCCPRLTTPDFQLSRATASAPESNFMGFPRLWSWPENKVRADSRERIGTTGSWWGERMSNTTSLLFLQALRWPHTGRLLRASQCHLTMNPFPAALFWGLRLPKWKSHKALLLTNSHVSQLMALVGGRMACVPAGKTPPYYP